MKLSIITICYNNAEGLRQTLTSTLRKQGAVSEFEQLVVDGGSKDGTLEVIREYEGGLAWWCSEPDKGIYNAMNKGVAHANGDYLLFLNSGDILLDRSLEKIFANDFTEDIVYSDIYASDGENMVLLKSPTDAELTPAYLTINTLPHQATLIRRSLHNALGGYDESMKISAAPKFILDAIMGKKCTTRYLEMVYSIFDRSGISSDISFLPKKLREWQYLLRPHFGERVAESFFRAKIAEKLLSRHVIAYVSKQPEKIKVLCQAFNDVTKSVKDGAYQKPRETNVKHAAKKLPDAGEIAYRRKVEALQQEVKELKRSTAYRVGMALTWPLRKVYRSLKKNGGGQHEKKQSRARKR